MKQLTLRYFVFILGLYFLSLGVVCIVKSSLGTTPISSINYVLSLNTPVTLGTATFLLNMLLIAGQFMLIHGIGSRKDVVEILLQIPFSFAFGAFIDINMWLCSGLEVNSYLTALGLLAAGCLTQAVGVVFELKPNVAIMSAEGFVKYAARRYNRDFGKLKVRFDVALVTMAALLSLVLSGTIEGIREGTAIAAITTGYTVSFLSLHVFSRSNLQTMAGLLHIHRYA
ncbi:MAG: DUF6198 family protein [Bacteroidales bacterium]|nr:DUF6198 family protein [Bacteroidales bacterium]